MGTALAALLISCGIAAEPTQALADGIELYHAFEFEQAVFSFQRAAVDPGASADERAVALAWLGMAQAAVGDLQGAKRSFLEAHRTVALADLPEEVSPKVADLFEEARAAVAAAADRPEPAANTAPSEPSSSADAGQGAGDQSLVLIGGAVSAAGAAALLGAAALWSFGAERAAYAAAPSTFQDDAKAALDLANGLAVSAAVAGGVGVVAVAAGVVTVGLAALE